MTKHWIASLIFLSESPPRLSDVSPPNVVLLCANLYIIYLLGKTTTLIGMINAVHLYHYNNFYEQVVSSPTWLNNKYMRNELLL